MFRGGIGTIGLKQVENQMKPNKCDFRTLLIMLYFCTENERDLFSIENRPVGFYTECLLSFMSRFRWNCIVDGVNSIFPYRNKVKRTLSFNPQSRNQLTINESLHMLLAPIGFLRMTVLDCFFFKLPKGIKLKLYSRFSAFIPS